jgi:hypothetical protein
MLELNELFNQIRDLYADTTDSEQEKICLDLKTLVMQIKQRYEKSDSWVIGIVKKQIEKTKRYIELWEKLGHDSSKLKEKVQQIEDSMGDDTAVLRLVKELDVMIKELERKE